MYWKKTLQSIGNPPTTSTWISVGDRENDIYDFYHIVQKKTLQENHIYNVFLAYAILQFERKKHRLKSPEKSFTSH